MQSLFALPSTEAAYYAHRHARLRRFRHSVLQTLSYAPRSTSFVLPYTGQDMAHRLRPNGQIIPHVEYATKAIGNLLSKIVE